MSGGNTVTAVTHYRYLIIFLVFFYSCNRITVTVLSKNYVGFALRFTSISRSGTQNFVTEWPWRKSVKLLSLLHRDILIKWSVLNLLQVKRPNTGSSLYRYLIIPVTKLYSGSCWRFVFVYLVMIESLYWLASKHINRKRHIQFQSSDTFIRTESLKHWKTLMGWIWISFEEELSSKQKIFLNQI